MIKYKVLVDNEYVKKDIWLPRVMGVGRFEQERISQAKELGFRDFGINGMTLKKA